MTTESSQTLEARPPSPIGGWLVFFFVVLGLWTLNSTLRLVHGYEHVPFMNRFSAILNYSDHNMSLGWSTALFVEQLQYHLRVIGGFLLLMLGMKKHYRFPRSVVIFLLVYIAISIANLILTAVFDPETGELHYGVLKITAKELIGAMIALVIWWTYSIKSKRVKNTFVKT